MIDWYIILIILDIILIYSIYSGFQVKVVREAVQAEAEALSSEAEARPRHLSTCPRRGRGEALRCLEAASRPRHRGRGHIPGDYNR